VPCAGWHRRPSGRAAVLCRAAAALKPSLSLSPSPVGVTAPGWADPVPQPPEPELSQHQGRGLSSHQQKLGHAASPGVGSGAASPKWGPLSSLALGQGCSWGALLSLQHPSPGWGAIALIRDISLAQLRSSGRLESVGAACWLPGNQGAVLLWQCGQPGGPPARRAPGGEGHGDAHGLGRDGDIPRAQGQQDMPKSKTGTCCGARAWTLERLESPHRTPAQPQTPPGCPVPAGTVGRCTPCLCSQEWPPQNPCPDSGLIPTASRPAAAPLRAHGFCLGWVLGAEAEPPTPPLHQSPSSALGTGAMLHPARGAGPAGARGAHGHSGRPPAGEGFLGAGWVPGSRLGTNNGSPDAQLPRGPGDPPSSRSAPAAAHPPAQAGEHVRPPQPPPRSQPRRRGLPAAAA